MNISHRPPGLLGWLLALEGAFMLLPFVVGLIYREDTAWYFLGVGLASIVLGLGLSLQKGGQLGLLHAGRLHRHRPGLDRAEFLRLRCPFTSAERSPVLPTPCLRRCPVSPPPAPASCPTWKASHHCMLFWRSFTHWLGGMGVLVFMLAVCPAAGRLTACISCGPKAPGPSVGKLVPKVRQTAAHPLYHLLLCMTRHCRSFCCWPAACRCSTP